MHSVYDRNSRVLSISGKNSVSYELFIRKDIVIVSGESASGKSMLCGMISDAKSDKNPVASYDVSNIVILSGDNLPLLTGFEKKLIIIDEAHLLLREEHIEYINASRNVRFLVFDRVPIGLNVTPNGKADLVCEDGVFRLKYRYDVKGG